MFSWRFDQFTRARTGSIEMVKWIGKFSLLVKRFEDGWMDISLTGSSDSRVSDEGCRQNTSSHAHFSQSLSVPPALTALFLTFHTHMRGLRTRWAQVCVPFDRVFSIHVPCLPLVSRTQRHRSVPRHFHCVRVHCTRLESGIPRA